MTRPVAETTPEMVGHATIVHARFVVRALTIEDAEGVRSVAAQAARVPDLEAEVARLRELIGRDRWIEGFTAACRLHGGDGAGYRIARDAYLEERGYAD